MYLTPALKKPSAQTHKDIDALYALNTIAEVRGAYIDMLPRYGFTHMIMAHVVNPFMYSQEYMGTIQTNWNPAWLSEWITKRYFFHDAVPLAALRRGETFSWDEALSYGSPTAHKIAERAKSFGLIYGIAVPIIHPTKLRGCVSLSTANPDEMPTDWVQITALSRAFFMHIETLRDTLSFDERPNLTHREIETLYLVAAGKTNWETGQMLQISQYSVRDHLKAISRKLKTVNRAHSVARAIQLGLILP